MSEIKSYDIAANRFNTNLKINSLPINSWDLFAPFFDKICMAYRDITMLSAISKKQQWEYNKEFNRALFEKEHVIVVTDAHLNIVHATRNITDMNGYKPEEIVGKKPKIFQGAETCEKTTKQIGAAVKNKTPFEAIVLNYRKDGSTYNCWIKGEPIFNASGKVVNFIAYEKEVA
jgi:PAS domain S-box-containing protein